jgi:hypothetical protein
MHLVMTTATIGTFAIGQAEERASPVFLFFIAEFAGYPVDPWLMNLPPNIAHVKESGNERDAPHVHDITMDQMLVSKCAERVLMNSGQAHSSQARLQAIAFDKTGALT